MHGNNNLSGNRRLTALQMLYPTCEGRRGEKETEKKQYLVPTVYSRLLCTLSEL